MTDEHDEVLAIDVHGHYGSYFREGMLGINAFMSADASELVSRAHRALTRIRVVSLLRALIPRKQADPVAGNRDAAQAISENPSPPRTPELWPAGDQISYQMADLPGAGRC